MDIRFLPHNLHHDDPALFFQQDPHLRQLKKYPLVHQSKLLNHLPLDQPGIYTVTGARQIGKTTLLKQWMVNLLKKNVLPESIVYFSGELIDDHHALVRLFTEALTTMPEGHYHYFILDEVSYIRDWDKGIKYMADAGMLEDTISVLTGSDLVVIQEARMRFPGRRGDADTVNFHMYPLSFQESVQLKKIISDKEMEKLSDPAAECPESTVSLLFQEFHQYLAHGGFLTAMNDMQMHQRILPATFSTYSDWIRGDILKRNKQDHYLQEIAGAIINRYGSQISWNALTHDLSIEHPKTVADYIALMVSMDAVFIQFALLENKLAAAPKKARKVMFTDPFIFHAINAWINPNTDPYNFQVLPVLNDTSQSARLVEACVATHFSRYFSTYYIKAKGEVDIAYVKDKKFWPVEIKWTRQIRSKDLKQISKYPNGRIWTRLNRCSEINGIFSEPLPLALLRLESAL